MLKKTVVLGTLVGVVLGATSSIVTATSSMEAMPPQTAPAADPFQRIDQPLSTKVAVTLAGLGLMGLELWWFLFSKPKSRQAGTQAGIQEVTVMVDGGYEPNQIVVQAGSPVRLKFDRRDPSSCLEEIRLPEFRIAQELPLNQVTLIEFTPTQPGRYEFTCGMNMFRGVVEVQRSNQT